MHDRDDDPQAALRDLERRLESLARAGVRWLNVAPAQPTAAAVHPAPAAHPAPAEQPVPPRERPPDAAHQAVPETSAAAGAADARGAGALEALRLEFHDCQRCQLAPSRQHLVFGVGSERPRLMFIGEGPGADEDAQGEPFVGRAGRVLTALIEALGLVRDDVYITNVVKCRPPGNRNPEPDEIASCRPILQRQIEALDPRLIVTLGNVPLKAFKPGAGGITRERGAVFTYQRWEVLPTFHPSYLLRNPAAIETAWLDFRKALAIAYPRA